jgi:diacylglycerol kinase (ATP)
VGWGALDLFDGAGLSETDRFFEAKGHFDIIRTCNIWISRMIRAAGLNFGAWTPTPCAVNLSQKWHHYTAAAQFRDSDLPCAPLHCPQTKGADMGNQPLKGMARIAAALRNSLVGFRDVWTDEEAFRIECVLLVLSIPAALWIAPTLVHAALLIGSVLFIMIVEVLNSAIENVVDRIGPERHELSRKAKDMGSLAVLLATLLAGLLWIATLAQAVFA